MIRETKAKHVEITMLALSMLTVNQDSKQVNLQLGQTVETTLLYVQSMYVRVPVVGYRAGLCGSIEATYLYYNTAASGTHVIAMLTTRPNPLLTDRTSFLEFLLLSQVSVLCILI